jgi:hypothetical protein
MPSAAYLLLLFAGVGWLSLANAAEPPKTNEDESKVAPYTLPDPLLCLDGTRVTDASTWSEKRRPELLELYRAQMFGRSPARPADQSFEVTSTDRAALGGAAVRKEVTVRLSRDADAPPLHLLIYLPAKAARPAPTFISINFAGNFAAHADPGITLHPHWMWKAKEKREELVQPAEKDRNSGNVRWPFEAITARGYAVVTLDRSEVEPDYPQGWKHGIRGYFLRKSGKSEFAPDDWGAIAAWAWSMSRAMDYVETDRELDASRVAIMGHSRLGKAALWAGAEDPRFKIVISNDSGEGGAALSRRNFGETVWDLNDRFPHWFCGNFKQYSSHEDRLPFDAHELIALSAPRPVYVASAAADTWADPNGEFLAAKNAEPVYRLFGKTGLGVDDQPPVDRPVIGTGLGYHVRTGKHDVLRYDWEQYLALADRQFAPADKSK